ncbi:hypothetical protein [uncultured Erythrobacter sp.]|uniref:hypothetical protein n=1 Tax=uncultured Erythrobacter sp. TaxID=263913 RepID=UPI002659A7BF|nr:hypothetical protein [uncultured Erythrobacter sp.]
MKKFLMVAVAAAALTATPAMAGNSVQISPTATVASVCELSANVRSIANGAGDTPIGYEPTTQTTTVTAASSAVNLGVTSNQLLASLTVRCNTGAATMAVATQNNFQLQSGTSAIPYLLSTTAAGAVTDANAPFTQNIPGTGVGAQQTRQLNFRLASAVNPLLLAPGNYSDTITVTVTPNT